VKQLTTSPTKNFRQCCTRLLLKDFHPNNQWQYVKPHPRLIISAIKFLALFISGAKLQRLLLPVQVIPFNQILLLLLQLVQPLLGATGREMGREMGRNWEEDNNIEDTAGPNDISTIELKSQ
jgi:hypothetical protein